MSDDGFAQIIEDERSKMVRAVVDHEENRIEGELLRLARVDRSTYVEGSVRVPLGSEAVEDGTVILQWIERRDSVSVMCRCQIATAAVVLAINRGRDE